MQLSILIVNWNTGEQLRDCLFSIAKYSAGQVSKVVVVDNASNDGSARDLELFNIPLEVIRNSKNLGFARACNQGAAVCDSRYLLFLNPDTRIFKNSLDVPIAYMEEECNSDVGICSIQLVDEKGVVSKTCSRFPTLPRIFSRAVGLNKLPGQSGSAMLMEDWAHDSDQVVDQVIGAFFFTRRDVFEVLKGFDERFFVYYEEVDYSYRAMEQGWRTVFLSGAQAFHLGGGSSSKVKAKRLFYSLRSRLLYGFKHFPFWQAWLHLLLTLLIEPITRSFSSLLWGGVKNLSNNLVAYGMLYRDIPNILSKSFKNKTNHLIP